MSLLSHTSTTSPDVQFFANLEHHTGYVMVAGTILTRDEAEALACRLSRAVERLDRVSGVLGGRAAAGGGKGRVLNACQQ